MAWYITKRRDPEHSRDFLATIVESSDNAIVAVSRDGRIMTWNTGAENLSTGFAADEAIGRFVADVYIPAINRETIATESKVDIAAFEREPELVRRRDLMVQRKDGALVEVSLAQSALLDSARKSVGIVSTMLDITKQRRTEREQAQLAAIVNASEDAIISTSADLKIVTWNLGAQKKAYGFTAEEAVGSGLELFVPEDALAMQIEACNRVMRTGECRSALNWWPCVQTRLHTLLRLTSFPPATRAARSFRVRASASDITEQLPRRTAAGTARRHR